MFDFIANYLGQFLYFIYKTIAFENYGLAIIVFTIIIKLALLPLTLKQLKSSAKMQEVQPRIQELQRMYKNDKEKLNQEMMKFYQENKINPVAGCLPLLVQFPILISLYWTIAQPLKFMLGKGSNEIKALTTFVKENAKTYNFNFSPKAADAQIQILDFFNQHDKLLGQVGKYLKESELIHMMFPMQGFGINLGTKPVFPVHNLNEVALLIIPILAVVFTYISTKISMPKASKNAADNKNTQMMSMMVYIAPLMTLMFAFQFPIGLALYWTTGYVFQIGQQIFINKYKLKEEVGKK